MTNCCNPRAAFKSGKDDAWVGQRLAAANGVRTYDPQFARCSQCAAVACYVCKATLQSHVLPGHLCALPQPSEEELREVAVAINGSCKRCPGCRTGIDRIDGCNTMTCLECHSIFCWLCGEVLCNATEADSNDRAHSHFNQGGEFVLDGSCVGFTFGNAHEFRARNNKACYTGFEPPAAPGGP